MRVGGYAYGWKYPQVGLLSARRVLYLAYSLLIFEYAY